MDILSCFICLFLGLLLFPLTTQASRYDNLKAEHTQQKIFNPYGFSIRQGIYRCELNREVAIQQISSDMLSAVLRWERKDYTLHAVRARTGALRYEDPQSGLVWLGLSGKSMLLNRKNGRQLANECKT